MNHRPKLTVEEEATWTSLYVIAQCIPGMLDQRLRADAGLGHTEYAVLHALSRTSQRSDTMARLSRATATSYSRLSHAITRLEDRGLVTRAREGSSRRVALTGEGRRVFVAAAAGHMDEIRRNVLDHVPPARIGELGELLQPIAEYLRANMRRG